MRRSELKIGDISVHVLPRFAVVKSHQPHPIRAIVDIAPPESDAACTRARSGSGHLSDFPGRLIIGRYAPMPVFLSSRYFLAGCYILASWFAEMALVRKPWNSLCTSINPGCMPDDKGGRCFFSHIMRRDHTVIFLSNQFSRFKGLLIATGALLKGFVSFVAVSPMPVEMLQTTGLPWRTAYRYLYRIIRFTRKHSQGFSGRARSFAHGVSLPLCISEFV